MYGFLVNFPQCIHIVIAIHISFNFLFIERNGRDDMWAWNPIQFPLYVATCLLIKVHYILITRAFDLKFPWCGRLRPISSRQLFNLVKLLLNSMTNQAIILLHNISFKIEPTHQLASDYLTHSENRLIPYIQYVLVEALAQVVEKNITLRVGVEM